MSEEKNTFEACQVGSIILQENFYCCMNFFILHSELVLRAADYDGLIRNFSNTAGRYFYYNQLCFLEEIVIHIFQMAFKIQNVEPDFSSPASEGKYKKIPFGNNLQCTLGARFHPY